MKITLVQYNPVWEDKKKNREKLNSLIKGSTNLGDLLIFPEMTLTGFSMDTRNLSEEKDGESFWFFSELARNHSVDVITGIIEMEKNNFFNTLLHISASGELVTFYRKVHPFSYSSENKFYTGGEKPVQTQIGDWTVGLSICYDLRFPELFRFYARGRVDLLVNIANWPVPRIEHWRVLLKARAIENQCYTVGVNRVGKDPNADYSGFTSVFDPMGKEIISVSNEEKLIHSELYYDLITKTREKLPFLNDIKLIS